VCPGVQDEVNLLYISQTDRAHLVVIRKTQQIDKSELLTVPIVVDRLLCSLYRFANRSEDKDGGWTGWSHSSQKLKLA